MKNNKYEMTIGIECHVQLATATKLFSGAKNDSREAVPNENASPIDWGLPGMLPVLNERAVELAARLGLALDAKINLASRFDRKHYFYPDLPSGFQRTQLYEPIIGEGLVELPSGGKVRVEHAHLEEDAGKLTHVGEKTLVDLNRAGTPLVEIVSMPDMHSAREAREYCQELQKLAIYSGASDADLYHGNMRFDVNISVAEPGAKKLGTRVEVKNINSFKAVERAVEYEFKRQVGLIEKGEKFGQETRGWDENKQKTVSQRSKEEAMDYRYMPEPDVPPVRLAEGFVDGVRAEMPVLHTVLRHEFLKIGLGEAVVETLLDNHGLALRMHEVVGETDAKTAKRVADWFSSVWLAAEVTSTEIPSVAQLLELAEMVAAGELSSTAAKEVLLKMSVGSPRAVAEKLQLLQVSDEGALEEMVERVLALPAAAKAVADVKAGEMKALGFLVGLVMKESKGQANPGKVQGIIKSKV
ncbi:Asp-tRNA(Asn)/Glu-tRNA(Gln) amidotransferase subunit GatB [Candidatus Saccharibacteria bacterium]|nr:Asp-tRNA(Asn)/Glu-tRNA(Gln) amidotransferase subunit GatB [Candidatus Saccharibacteria bacterium]